MPKKDDRIRVFHKPNGGSSSARNLGISMAKGEWIGFVDSDDWIEPQMYERLYEAATAAGTSIAQASRDEIDEDYHKRPDVCTPPETGSYLYSGRVSENAAAASGRLLVLYEADQKRACLKDTASRRES